MTPKVQIKSLLGKIDDFPPLPTVVSKVIQINADPRSCIDDMQRVIQAELALTTSILKLANSSFFGFSRQISTLHEALVALGMNEVKNLILAKTMFQAFKVTRKKTDIFKPLELWKHSFFCALATKTIAETVGENKNEFFIAGLIHDIGKLVMYQESHIYEKLLSMTEEKEHLVLYSAQIEQELLDMDHGVLGMQLLKKWLFPQQLQIAVGYHHIPENAPDFNIFPLIVGIGDLFSWRYQFAKDGLDDIAEIIKANIAIQQERPLVKECGWNMSIQDIEDLFFRFTEIVEAEQDIVAMLET